MPRPDFRLGPKFLGELTFAVLILTTVFILASCSSGTVTPPAGLGAAAVSISDPPSCMPPNGNIQHVFVSIRSVQAHISATADDNASGWQELTPQLNAAPVQIDLLSKPSTGCALAQLGNTTSLPVGTYQQIRLLLVPNNPGSNPVPAATSNCGGSIWNCVVLADGSIHTIDLSSQANTGLKIPPGQIVGGPITVAAGQSVDLNIDFNTCFSLIQQGNGNFRLKPTLTAGQVSANNTGITGQVVDSVTGLPIPNGAVLVALELPTSPGVDTIFMQAAADSNGKFNFCPLPASTKFDVVAIALNRTTGLAYNATVLTGVPGGTALGAIPVMPEVTALVGPATIQGFITALNGSNVAATPDVSMSALQSIESGTLLVTVPLEADSTQNIQLTSAASCPSASPLSANCSAYTLVVPASNPMVGAFSSTISYTPPAAGPILYTVTAQASVPLSGNIPECIPPLLTTNQNTNGQSLAVTAGTTSNAKEIDFSGCQ
ncbi:MAG: hypothetical protein PVS2B2_14810 [Candidatus Acidiferrum sp.]